MTTMRIDTATIEVKSEVHGTFIVKSDAYQRMIETYFGSVNQNRRVLAAVASHVVDVNYFDADELTLLAVLLDAMVTTEDLTRYLAHSPEQFVEDMWNCYVENA